MRAISCFIAGGVALAFVGCGGGSPQSSLDAYADAVEANQAEQAYAILSEDFRERVDAESFAERFEAQQDAREELVKVLERAAEQPAFVDARVPYTEFDVLELSLGPDGWKIERGLFNFYGQRTPRETLYSFIKAVERRKYDVLMRFVPSEFAGHMSAELMQTEFEANPARIDEMIALLRQNKDNLIRRQGKVAWMDYGPYRVDFTQEDGIWKILDPD